MSHVDVHPKMLRWAMERARLQPKNLEKKFKGLGAWLNEEKKPTFKQLSDFAKITSAPLGYFFLPEPPEETLPIPDFRTLAGGQIRRPSADLLDTLYAMQRRRDWMRETLLEEDAEPLGFVGSARLTDSPESVAHEMRRALDFEEGWANKAHTWESALSQLRFAIEELGVLAVINGIVANNTHRKLDPKEFRGFALCDKYAPLVFVNGADSKSAQMFTLIHELAHIWLGREAISGFEGGMADGNEVEKFCDATAAEFLVPAKELLALWPKVVRNPEPFLDIARHFKVSPIVAARRAHDLRKIAREAFFNFYNAYTAEERHKKKGASGGGDFYNNQNFRVGERFALEVIRAAKEGRIQYREAYTLTGLRGDTFDKYAQRLGFDLL